MTHTDEGMGARVEKGIQDGGQLQNTKQGRELMRRRWEGELRKCLTDQEKFGVSNDVGEGPKEGAGRDQAARVSTEQTVSR
jgi:hypothetical protein